CADPPASAGLKTTPAGSVRPPQVTIYVAVIPSGAPVVSSMNRPQNDDLPPLLMPQAVPTTRHRRDAGSQAISGSDWPSVESETICAADSVPAPSMVATKLFGRLNPGRPTK